MEREREREKRMLVGSYLRRDVDDGTLGRGAVGYREWVLCLLAVVMMNREEKGNVVCIPYDSEHPALLGFSICE